MISLILTITLAAASSGDWSGDYLLSSQLATSDCAFMPCPEGYKDLPVRVEQSDNGQIHASVFSEAGFIAYGCSSTYGLHCSTNLSLLGATISSDIELFGEPTKLNGTANEYYSIGGKALGLNCTCTYDVQALRQHVDG